MTRRPSPALREALALLRSPRGARPGPEDPLPEGVETLLRIVAGDVQAQELAARTTGETEAAVRDAAAFYLQQVMFASGSDSYRVLGLDPLATEEQLKSHHRLLTRWLHPDRNRDEWEAVYSERVNRAWQDLRTSDRRRRYDLGRSDRAAENPAYLRKSSRKVANPPIAPDRISLAWNLRWLPHAIFGGLGLSAVTLVALYYATRVSAPAVVEDAPSAGSDNRYESSALVAARAARGGLETRQASSAQLPAPPPALPPVAELPEPALPPARQTPLAAALAAPQVPTLPPPPSNVVSPTLAAAIPSSRPLRGPSTALPSPRVAATAPVPEPTTGDAVAQVPAGFTPRAATSAPVPGPPVRETLRSAPVSEREAARIVGRFREVYADGDLAGMREMFTSDATSPDGGLDQILKGYDRLFGHSRHRLLEVQDVNWSASGKTFTIVASYQATVNTGLLARTRSRGKLRMEMRQVGEEWRIYRLDHDELTD